MLVSWLACLMSAFLMGLVVPVWWLVFGKLTCGIEFGWLVFIGCVVFCRFFGYLVGWLVFD